MKITFEVPDENADEVRVLISYALITTYLKGSGVFPESDKLLISLAASINRDNIVSVASQVIAKNDR